MKSDNKERGFTLIELLVVISIIGLLSSVVLVNLNSARAKGRDAKRLEDMHQFQNAVQLYITSNGNPPPATPDRGDGWAESYISGSSFMSNLVPSALSRVLVDPTNSDDYHSYYYRVGNYGNFCPNTPVAIIHFYVESAPINNSNIITCSAQGGPYGECLCIY